MQNTILLAHGGGGVLTSDLIKSAILSRFSNPILDKLDDSAVLMMNGNRIAFTSDSYTVTPIFFPGGNIGDLAVCGTVNDLAMAGATPKYLSLSLILEEGLPLAELESVLDAIRSRAEQAGVAIVCGDTKVVERGQADGMYINTAGVGEIPGGVDVSSRNVRPGDAILISGTPGLHGLAVMLARGDLNMDTPVISDVAPLNDIVAAMLESGVGIRCMRDITRGGLAMGLNDVAVGSNVSVRVIEESIPASKAQSAACDLLGLDVLHIASEGCFMAVVDPADAERAVQIMRDFPAGKDAALIGSAMEKGSYAIEMITSIGSRRVVTPARGEQLPRIC